LPERRSDIRTAKLKAYFELTKPRLTFLNLLVAMASFYLARPGAVDFGRMAISAAGIGLLAAGVLALNGWMERGSDLLMRRTRDRPVPSGRLTPREALVFGAVTTAVAVAVITIFLGTVASVLAAFTFASYVLIYTPLKRRTTFHTTLGAVSGAMPPLLGWAAAQGSLDPDAWLLAAILFLWQYPHFLAIDTMYRDDYSRAGIKVLPGGRPNGARATGAVSTAALVLLLAASTGPYFTGMAGSVYLVGCLVLGVGFLVSGIAALVRRTPRAAKMVLKASVTYLPIVFGLLVFTVKS
jgi:protoheme IX farnesyltransferase